MYPFHLVKSWMTKHCPPTSGADSFVTRWRSPPCMHTHCSLSTMHLDTSSSPLSPDIENRGRSLVTHCHICVLCQCCTSKTWLTAVTCGIYNSTTHSGCPVLSLIWLNIVHALLPVLTLNYKQANKYMCTEPQ